MKIITVLRDCGPFCIEQTMASVDCPPFLAWLLPVETPEQVQEAIAFEQDFERRKAQQENADA
jgi:hypothetical protein